MAAFGVITRMPRVCMSMVASAFQYGCAPTLIPLIRRFTSPPAWVNCTRRRNTPLAVGWRLKLVDARSGQIIWSVDELFDAARPGVFRAAQRFERPGFVMPFFHDENWVAD